MGERRLITKYDDFQKVLYYDGQKESIALVMGEVENAESVLCRVHSACVSAHVFNSIECDCREQMETSQQLIQEAGKGVIIWLDQEGRGNGNFALMNAAKMAKEDGIRQSEAYVKLGFKEDARNFVRAADILSDLKVKSVILLTNNPEKAKGLAADCINIAGTQRVTVDTTDNDIPRNYYADKIARGHDLKTKE